jgi:hypothetical protein
LQQVFETGFAIPVTKGASIEQKGSGHRASFRHNGLGRFRDAATARHPSAGDDITGGRVAVMIGVSSPSSN